MCDDDIHPGLVEDSRLSRRGFGLLTVAGASLAAAPALAQSNVVEKDVAVKTADGTSDCALFYPVGKGAWPAVLIWPDIMGLRPAFRDMGRRLAGEGYVVLVVNPFYRSAKAPVIGDKFDFSNPEQRARLTGYRAAIGDDGADRDSVAYLTFLDAQPQTNKIRKAGVQGYCMGGPLSFRTAAIAPNRVGAVGSFHGGGLVTKDPTSPHLLIEKSSAQYLVAVAKNDDTNDPEAKNVLRDTFAKTGRKAVVEVYGGDHGWCVPDNGRYDKAEAERAWTALGALYKAALV